MRFNIIRSPAYEEGRNAYQSGVSQDSNPYASAPESTASIDWLQGYAEASADQSGNDNQ